MRIVLKWIGIAALILVAGIIVLNVGVYFASNARINKTYAIEPDTVAIKSDEETITHGEHIAVIFGCTDCHGKNLAGAAMIEDPAIAQINAPNITAGAGGVSHYSETDFIRAIRHGVDAEGKPLFIMPSNEYFYLGDEDLGALIAYLQSVEPVDNELPEKSVGQVGRILFTAGMLPPFAAEVIDHTAVRPDAPTPGVTAAYGRYLAVGCTGCHGENYAGGSIPGSPPDAPPAANLTPSGELAEWTTAEFIQTMRTGTTPDGHQLNATDMPWPSIGQMTDDELTAVFLYLQSLEEIVVSE